MDKIDIKDYIYMEQLPEGDPDFSEEHNNYVIQSVIKKTDKMRRQKRREFEQGIKENSEAAAHYLMALEKGASTSAEKYFGRRELARLRGEQLLEKLKATPELKEKLRKRFN